MKTMEQKREEAAKRQAAYDSKPMTEKLSTAGKKERRKLLQKLKEQENGNSKI